MDEQVTYQELLEFLYRAPAGLIQATREGTIEMINPACSRMLMTIAPDGELENLFTVLRTLAPELRGLCAAADEDEDALICEGMRLQLVGWRRAPDCVISLSMLATGGTHLIAVLLDVTRDVRREQERLERRLFDAARTDPHTMLPNRIALRQRLAQIAGRAPGAGDARMALVFLNADRFHQINDTWGPAEGNRFIFNSAMRLQGALAARFRATRSISAIQPYSARVGPDEFAVVLEQVASAADAEQLAQELILALGQPWKIDETSVRCTFSAGVVVEQMDRVEADRVLQDASIAMTAAKRAGGAQVQRFDTALRDQAARAGGLEADLRRALGNHELFLAYQPVVALQDAARIRGHQVLAVEALVRWQHPERGLVPPLEFIGVAEHCGLIGEIGAFVLETACRYFVTLRARLGDRAPRRLAVNLSRAQIALPDWSAQVFATLNATGMRPEDLQFEITESLAAQHEEVRHRLQEVKAIGVSLALDDFGTGYSSLSSLHLLPVDTVKIDRSFVAQSDSSDYHRALVEATVQVARSLRMRTIAEGIETEAQAAALTRSGCDAAQGFLFAPALTAPALEAWLNAQGGATAPGSAPAP